MIAVISDIHDNLVNLEKCLNWCSANSVEQLVCCGDVTNSETLDFLATNFLGQIYIVRGNMEIYDEDELAVYPNIINGGRSVIFDIAGKKVGVCHEPFLIKEVMAKGKPDIIFYGHTHKPWLEDKDKTALINPGTLGGVFTAATFAIWDEKNGWPILKVLDLL
jgi:uncharacterized protein